MMDIQFVAECNTNDIMVKLKQKDKGKILIIKLLTTEVEPTHFLTSEIPEYCS